MMGVMADQRGEARPNSRPAAAEGGRRPTGAAAGRKKERGRWTSRRKMEVVLRLLRGEDLDALSRELKVKTSSLAKWRDDFLAAGQAGLKSRKPDFRDEELRRLKAKVGELTMANELLEEKIELLENNVRPRKRRSRW